METDIQMTLRQAVDDAVRAAEALRQPDGLAFLEKAAQMIAECFRGGHKVLVAGNGGSMCDAMHFAEEFTGRFRHNRPALPAIALSDPGHMSCVGNDFGFEEIFARSVDAMGAEGDVLVALTTSGNSPNILRAIEQAQARGMRTIAFLGKSGGKVKGLCDLEWLVSGFPYSDRVQEAHMAAIHVIIELVEKHLYAP